MERPPGSSRRTMTDTNHDASRKFRIRGRVQGVGFRAWTERQANTLQLRGTVRNCPDGTVEVRVAGPHKTIDRFRALLASGPPAARVAAVDETYLEDTDLPPDFRQLP